VQRCGASGPHSDRDKYKAQATEEDLPNGRVDYWNVNVRKCYAAPGQCSDYAGDANGHHRSSEVFHYGILFYAKRVFQA